MPYTEKTARARYHTLVEVLNRCHIYDAADLAYLITQLLNQYLEGREVRWKSISDADKALTAAQLAFREDVYLPYERNKRNENGEIFT